MSCATANGPRVGWEGERAHGGARDGRSVKGHRLGLLRCGGRTRYCVKEGLQLIQLREKKKKTHNCSNGVDTPLPAGGDGEKE